MKQLIALFCLFFFCITVQAADKAPSTAGKPVKPQTRAIAPADVKSLGAMIARGESNDAIVGKWKSMLIGANDKNLNVNSLIQSVTREAQLQQAESVKKCQYKVRYLNETKKRISDEQDRARRATLTPGSAPLHKMNITAARGTPTVISTQNAGIVKSEQERQAYIRYLGDKLNIVGDDAQLANVDLQNVLQKQQQLLQMLSNISKLLSDTAMATIRKIGG